MNILKTLSTCGLACIASTSMGENAKAQQPNIILINIDDLEWADFS